MHECGNCGCLKECTDCLINKCKKKFYISKCDMCNNNVQNK